MNVKPKTMFTGDNLPIMRGMDTESVDLIYLDPPFNSKKQWSAPIGSKAAGAAFKDAWTLSDIDVADLGILAEDRPKLSSLINSIGDVNGSGDKSYLLMMASRLIEMRRILKPTGSIYLHCDPTMSHGLKMVMDAIWGDKNFISEIVWNYGTPSGGRVAGKRPVKSHDTLLAYAAAYGNHVYHVQHLPYSEKYKRDWFRHVSADGRKYQTRGRNGKVIRQYLDESPGIPLSNTWSDIKQIYGKSGWFPSSAGQKEKTGYPTQKPLELLQRIIKASSKEGDVVLDPFCGCATACIAAESLDRNWIGIDLSSKAIELVKQRFANDLGMFNPNIIHRTDIPIRSDGIVRSKNIKHTLYGKQEGNCNGCKSYFAFRHFEVDHIIPKASGGPDDDSNLQLLCGNCNRIKGDRSMGYLIESLKATGVIS